VVAFLSLNEIRAQVHSRKKKEMASFIIFYTILVLTEMCFTDIKASSH
jgi:hypothetical protein